MKTIFFASALAGATVLAGFSAAQAQDHLYQEPNRVEHGLYFRIRLGGNSNSTYSNEQISFGYRMSVINQSTMRSGYYLNDYQRLHYREPKLNYISLNFSSFRSMEMKLAGTPLLKFDQEGLRFQDQEEGEGGGQTALILLGGAAALGAALALGGSGDDDNLCDAVAGLVSLGTENCSSLTSQ